MKIITGTRASAKVFTVNSPVHAVESYAVKQIEMICGTEAAAGSRIRVMPDVHPGKVGPIGLTMTLGPVIMPGLLGIDIGCGITLAKLNTKKIEFQKLDKVIRENVPSGFAVRKRPLIRAEEFDFEELLCQKKINTEKALLSLGTLGGGNHFIEIDRDENGMLYAAVHSGSRHTGKELTEHYLKLGQKELMNRGIRVPYELTYLDGELKDCYLKDVKKLQEFAELNRALILAEISGKMKWKISDTVSCIHNYVDSSPETLKSFGAPILRKGAISAKAGEQVVIPVNMKDGILIGTGLGNTDWNCSAPHGSGRTIKRGDVRNSITLSAFKSEMKGIYSSCITGDTIDESPGAYRRIEEISEAVSDTVSITGRLRPVYSFKAGGKA
ncbi:MAG: RtcB family protein [Bacillota bacterium]|nr:RtcB family protein [Bacillota bacterium]